MNSKKHIWMMATALACAVGCQRQAADMDASGSFEADEVIVSAEASGIVMQLQIEEGQRLKAGQRVGTIDSSLLSLKRKQVMAQIDAVRSRRPDAEVQLAALRERLRNAQKERRRFSKLLEADAATKKQLDDIDAQIAFIKAQIEAQKSSLAIAIEGIEKEVMPLQAQLEQVNRQIRQRSIVNPIDGTVLEQYTKEKEMAGMGKPLYKIAKLSPILLRVYLSGDQLPEVKLNQQVTVRTDDGSGGMKEDKGTVTWISEKAEFTPKTIRTKDERANAVYAVKIKVKNDQGTYKIGMYGEITFN